MCRRHSTSAGQALFGMPIAVDSNGNITQGFNNEGTGTVWEGEIFIMYAV